ncbi:protein-glutamate O-methyltransferase CheR [Oleispirillum naphthae]|uniref:CheR family methyltransferase n=1 Tax=Oleispirillum naphthae TaxID=2838853 RepID=UPI0030823653
MKPEDFDFVAKLLKERSGLVLSKDKSYLLESRLMPVARRRGMKGLDELVAAIRRMDPALVKDVTEAMTTNESFFFRDTKPFDQFRERVLPALLTARKDKRQIRVWCAACSSGQEPYSLAIILKEMEAKLSGWRIDIVATDLSTEILEKAKAGLYSQFEVQRGMPITLLVKYFQKKDEMWQIDARLRAMVQYRPLNLLTDVRSTLGAFDVIFCRNVLIYFDQETKGKVLADVSKVMSPDGFLYLGGAETVLGISDKFRPIAGQRGMYELSGGAGAAPV